MIWDASFTHHNFWSKTKKKIRGIIVFFCIFILFLLIKAWLYDFSDSIVISPARPSILLWHPPNSSPGLPLPRPADSTRISAGAFSSRWVPHCSSSCQGEFLLPAGVLLRCPCDCLFGKCILRLAWGLELLGLRVDGSYFFFMGLYSLQLNWQECRKIFSALGEFNRFFRVLLFWSLAFLFLNLVCGAVTVSGDPMPVVVSWVMLIENRLRNRE